MAASSPVPNSSNIGEPVILSAAINGSTTPQRLAAIDAPKQNQRGHNKPKCIKCGNVARSRCPFQSCKNCCANAQNPCHIHVLKQSSILPAQPPPSTTPLPEQPSSDAPSTGASWRLSSLRQISAAFASSMRVKKPLTRKDAVNINRWRFSKLKEHIEGNIEAENEAFDRYMWNISLLEETFPTKELISDYQNAPDSTSSEDSFQKLVSSIKVKLRYNSDIADNHRKRIKDLIDQLLRKLHEESPYDDELDSCSEPKRSKKEGQWRAERTEAFSELIDKSSKARTKEDLKLCLEMKLQLLNSSGRKVTDTSGEHDHGKPGTMKELSVQPQPKMCTVVHMDQETLSNINAALSTHAQLAVL